MRAPEVAQDDILALHSQFYRMLDTGMGVPPSPPESQSQMKYMRKKLLRVSYRHQW